MKISRSVSFVAVSVIYVLASAVGIVSYMLIPGDMWLKLLLADVIATVFTFIFSVIFGNASVYDPYWSVQPIVILYAMLALGSFTLPKLLLLIAVSLWGIRLTANWAYTFMGLGHQDWRYTMLKEKCGIFYPIINFIGIHMVPTLVVYAATLPAAFVMESDAGFSPLSLIGFAVSVFAVLLQGVADIEMHKYRKNRTTTFIESGLWKYSRHPNYLAEILMWWGIALFTVATLGFDPVYLIGAVLNTLLFLFVSIPLADGRQSRKPGFEEYKRRTRMLLPFKK